MSAYNLNGPLHPGEQPGVTNSLGLTDTAYKSADEDAIDLTHYLSVFRKRWRFMAVVVAFIFGLGITYTLMQRPLYQSTAVLLVTSAKSNPLSALAGASPLLSDLPGSRFSNSVDTVATLITDRDTLESAFMSLGKDERTKGFDNTAALPDWAVSVGVKRNTDVIEVRARSYKPAIAAKLANEVINDYLKRDMDRSSDNIQHARSYTQEKLNLIKEQLEQANKELAAYKKEHGLFSPDTQVAKAAEFVTTLQLDLENATTELAACSRELAITEKQIAGEEPAVKSSTVVKQNPRFASVAATVDELYKSRTELLEEYTPQSPEILALDNRIQSHQDQLKDIAKTIVDAETSIRNPIRDGLITAYSAGVAKQAALQARIDALKSELDSIKTITSTLPEHQRKLTELVQQSALLERTYGLISDKYYALLISEQGISPGVQVVSSARAEEEPIHPSIVKGGLTSLLIGIMTAMLLTLGSEMLDTRLKDQNKIERLTGYFALTAVPQAPAGSSPLISTTNANLPILESFRVLRNNIYFASIESKMKVLAVTSTLPGEGKSVVSANLARAMAMDGKRVLLVDCNMHRPSLRTIMNAQCSTGLTNVLCGACDVDKAVVATNQDNLFLLTTGPLMLNFVESLNSEHGRMVFKQCSEKYDAVILDCPSLINLSDLQMISSLSDRMLLVVSQQHVKEAHLTAAMRSLAQIPCQTLGLVVNETEPGYDVETLGKPNNGDFTDTGNETSSTIRERV